MVKRKTRADGLYEATVRINGKKKHFYGRTLCEARAKRDEYKALMENCPLAEESITLSEWVMAWVENVKTTVSPVTYKSYYYTLRRYIQNAPIGHIVLHELTPTMFRNYFTEMLETKSPRTVNYLHTVLNQALKQAIEDGAMLRNPLTNIKHAKQERKEIETLSRAQIDEMLSLLPDRWQRLLFRIAVYTGLRLSEILGLDRDKSFDFDKNTITVFQSVIRTDEGLVLSEALKNASSRRTISVDKETMEQIRRQKIRTLQLKMQNKKFNDMGLLFCRSNGQPMSRNTIEKLARKTFNRMGLPKFTFHGLRHTHATLLLKSGVHYKIVQYRLGHSTFQQTMDTYSHVTPIMEQEVVKVIEHDA